MSSYGFFCHPKELSLVKFLTHLSEAEKYNTSNVLKTKKLFLQPRIKQVKQLYNDKHDKLINAKKVFFYFIEFVL